MICRFLIQLVILKKDLKFFQEKVNTRKKCLSTKPQQEFGLIALGGGSGAAGNFVVDAYPVSVHAWDIVLVFLTVLVVGFLSVWYPVRYLRRRLLGFSFLLTSG